MSLIIYFNDTQKDRGPGKLVHNLLKGLDLLNVEYSCNKDIQKIKGENIYCPQDHSILKSDFIKRMVIGPNICVLPFDSPVVMEQKYKKMIVPSEWVFDKYSKWISKEKLQIWAIGIDTNQFYPNKNTKRYDCLLYFKRRTNQELTESIKILNKFNQTYYLLEYGNYKEDDFVNLINSCNYSFILNGTESQGIAIQEIMSCNCPVFVWDIAFWNDRGEELRVPATSVPYWSSDCGIKTTNNIKNYFEIFLNTLNKYHPRDFIENNFNLIQQSKELLKLFKNE